MVDSLFEVCVVKRGYIASDGTIISEWECGDASQVVYALAVRVSTQSDVWGRGPAGRMFLFFNKLKLLLPTEKEENHTRAPRKSHIMERIVFSGVRISDSTDAQYTSTKGLSL